MPAVISKYLSLEGQSASSVPGTACAFADPHAASTAPGDAAIPQTDLLMKRHREKLTVTSGFDFGRVHGDLGSTWSFFSSKAYLIGSRAVHGRIRLAKA